MSRIKDANWRRLLLHQIKSCGYEPTSVRLIPSPGVTFLPGLLLEMHFEVNHRRFHLHVIQPKEPTRQDADNVAFRTCAVLAACAAGTRLPPTTSDVENLERRLSDAAGLPVPLLVHAQHDGCRIVGQCPGHDDHERRIRHSIHLTPGNFGRMAETDLANEVSKLSRLARHRSRLALPLADRYTIDPVLAAIVRFQGWTASKLLDLIAGAVGTTPDCIDCDLLRVDIAHGRMRVQKWNMGAISADASNIRIKGTTIPETTALSLIGERFDRLASGTPFGDMEIARIRPTTTGVTIGVGRHPLTLGRAVAMLGQNLHDGDWLVPGER